MNGYILTLKNGSTFRLSECGDVLHDGDRNMSFAANSGWRILGISKRHHSRRIITLKEAASGEPIGQGWIHDLDHGSHRLWGMPLYRRAVSVRAV